MVEQLCNLGALNADLAYVFLMSQMQQLVQ